jgi:fused signal recognition particle receptor
VCQACQLHPNEAQRVHVPGEPDAFPRCVSKLQADEDDAEPSSPRPAGLAARELQAKLAASRAGAGGGGGHQRLKGLLKGGSAKSKGAAAAAALPRRAHPQPQPHPGVPPAQQLPAAHEAAQWAQPQHRPDQPAAPRQQHSAAAKQQHAPSAVTAPTLQQRRPPQRPAAPRASPAKPTVQDPRSGGRPANRGAPGGSHAAEAAGQQRRPTAQRSIKRRDAGTMERWAPPACHMLMHLVMQACPIRHPRVPSSLPCTLRACLLHAI